MDIKISQYLRSAVLYAEELHSILGRPRHTPLPPAEAIGDCNAALAHLMSLLSIYAGAVVRSKAPVLLQAAAPLTAIGESYMYVWARDQEIDSSVTKQLQVARQAASAGVLDALGSLTCHINSLLQQHHQLTAQQLLSLVGLGRGLVAVIASLAVAWPQNLFKAKAFNRCLVPWVDLAAALPAVLQAALAGGLSPADLPNCLSHEGVVSTAMPSCFTTAFCLTEQIARAPVSKEGELILSSQAMKQIIPSHSLHKLLAWNFAAATLVKHHQASGVFKVTAYFEGAAGSSSEKHLKMPPYHQQLLSELGLTAIDLKRLALSLHSLRDTQVLAVWGMYFISDYLVPNSHRNQLNGALQLPASVGNSSGMRTRQRASTAKHSSGSNRSTAEASELSSKQQWGLSLLLTAIEWICLDSAAEPKNSVGLLALLMKCSVLPANILETDASGSTLMLPTAAALALLKPVMQLLLPAMTYLLRSTATTSARQRREAMQCLVTFLGPVITQVGPDDLAACICREAPAVAVAYEAFVRDYMYEFSGATEGWPAPNTGFARATSMSACTYRIMLAWQLLIKPMVETKSSGSLSCRKDVLLRQAGVAYKQPMQLMSVLASLMTTCLKCAAAVVLAHPPDQQGTLQELMVTLNQAAVTAEVGCWLGDIAAAQQALQAAQCIGNLHSSSSGPAGASNSITSWGLGNSSSRQDVGMATWVVLVARSVSLLSDTVVMAYGILGRGILARDRSVSPGVDYDVFVRFAIPYEELVSACLEMLTWLKGQLLGMAWLAQITSSSPTEGSPKVATAAAAAATTIPLGELQQLLQQHAAAAAATGELYAICLRRFFAFKLQSWSGSANHDDGHRLMETTAREAISNALIKVVWHSTWSGIKQFCMSVCDQLPLSSCCNTPGCLNLDKLSEHQLVGGKGSVCGGCGVARYCSSKCQKQHWKRHKPVCRSQRLQMKGQS